MLHQIKVQQLDSHFVVLISPLSQSSIFGEDFNTWISIFPKLLVLENCKIALRSPLNLLKIPCMNPVKPQIKCIFFTSLYENKYHFNTYPVTIFPIVDGT